MARCLHKNKIKTGLFVSPFAVSTTEKIQINGEYVGAKDFIEITEYIKPFLDTMAEVCPYGVATYFEIMFVLAIVYFVKKKCSWAVLEVGLGGTYDATNVIHSPVVSAITNVSLDHVEFLGNTLLKIASDKAGIIKQGSVFITSEQRNHLRMLFRKICKERGAKYISLLTKGLTYNECNIKLAEAISGQIGLINVDNLKDKMPMPCRFEIVSKRPLVIIDGAHNESKIKSVIFNLAGIKYRKLTIILAIAEDKNIEAIIRMLAPKADRLFLTHFSLISRKSAKLSTMYKLAKKYCSPECKIIIRTDQFKSFKEAKDNLNKKDAILITGSFFLTGEIRSIYYPEEKIVEHRASFF